MKDLPIFAGVTTAELELITSAAREKYFSEGEIMFKQGSPVREVAVLLSGSVELTACGSALKTIAPGALIEFIPPVYSSKHFTTAQAVEACWTLVWDLAEFKTLLVRIPTFRTNVLEPLKNHVERLRRKLCKQRAEFDIGELADRVMAYYETRRLIALVTWQIVKYGYK